VVAKKGAAKAAPPKAEAAPATNGKPVSLYGDVPVFTWKPKDGSAPIVFPKATTVIKKGEAFGFMYDLHEMAGDLVAQFAYMAGRAGVPPDVRRRAAHLPDDEVVELVSAWTAEMRAAPGES
jgi:hypothetical protein